MSACACLHVACARALVCSRSQERPKPWPVRMLGLEPPTSARDNPDGHPFFPLRDFSLCLRSPFPFPAPLLLSRNYYDPGWTGLRRLKNVIVLAEWAPAAGQLSLLSDAEHAAAAGLTARREAAVERAHALLAHHRPAAGGGLSRAGLADAVRAATGGPAEEALLDELARDFGPAGGGVPADGLRDLLARGRLRPEHRGRFWVGLSLAEAETLRRVLHLRRRDSTHSARCTLHAASQPPARVAKSRAARPRVRQTQDGLRH
jgi:hypothetical protein